MINLGSPNGIPIMPIIMIDAKTTKTGMLDFFIANLLLNNVILM